MRILTFFPIPGTGYHHELWNRFFPKVVAIHWVFATLHDPQIQGTVIAALVPNVGCGHTLPVLLPSACDIEASGLGPLSLPT